MNFTAKLIASICAALLTGDAAASPSCPAPQMNDQSPDPRAEILKYLAESDSPATLMGLPDRYSNYSLTALQDAASARASLPPLNPIVTSNNYKLDREARDRLVAKLSDLTAGRSSVITISKAELPVLGAVASEHVGEGYWDSLGISQSDSRVRVGLGDIMSINSPAALQNGISIANKSYAEQVVDGEDFGPPQPSPKQRYAPVQQRSTAQLSQCYRPAYNMAVYFRSHADIPDSIRQMIISNDPNPQIRSDAITFANLVNNVDACCLRQLSQLPPSPRRTIELNTGTVLFYEHGSSRPFPRGSATLVSPGVILTARHVVTGMNASQLRFSLLGQPNSEHPIAAIVEPSIPYVPDDDANDYAFLITTEDLGSGIPIGPKPDVGDPLLTASFNRLTFATETLYSRVSSIRASVPAWSTSVRWDGNDHCQVKEWITSSDGRRVCFQHGCQTEEGVSGAGLFTTDENGAVRLAGMQVGAARNTGCVPTTPGLGNIGIAIDPTALATAVTRRKELRGKIHDSIEEF